MVDGLVADGLPADGALDHCGGRLAGAEPRDADTAGKPPQRRLDRGINLGRGGLDLQGDLRRRLALERDSHTGGSLARVSLL